MPIAVDVLSKEDFAKWLAAKKESAKEAAAPAAAPAATARNLPAPVAQTAAVAP